MADEECCTCVLCGTVVTGFEAIATSECTEKLNCKPTKKQGKIYFKIPVESVQKAKKLRSIEHLFVVVEKVEDFGISNSHEDKEAVLKRLYQLVNDIDWNQGLEIWKDCTNYQGPLKLVEKPCDINAADADDDNQDDSICDNSVSKKAEDISSLPSFRVTCSRTGSKHSFSSVEAAASFGGSLNDLFHWRVDLSNADIEVLLNITNNNLVIGIALTRQSLGKRNIQHFGPTTLKSSIAYCLLHLACINPG